MGLYNRYILPRLINKICAVRPTMRQRQKVVPLASGNVLEIGIGSGLNLPLYDATRVGKVWGLEPATEMWALAAKRVAESPVPVEFLEAGAEAIPLGDAIADTIMLTYALCTIPEPETALEEMRRVLKPEGQLIFCEHGAAPDPSVYKWQKRVDPLWSRLAGGCHLSREIPGMLEAAGFKLHSLDTIYLPGWRPATFNYWGSAGIVMGSH
jgi:ubiquinone/menaquinone biosynthesis C-methylase UbiE